MPLEKGLGGYVCVSKKAEGTEPIEVQTAGLRGIRSRGEAPACGCQGSSRVASTPPSPHPGRRSRCSSEETGALALPSGPCGPEGAPHLQVE